MRFADVIVHADAQLKRFECTAVGDMNLNAFAERVRVFREHRREITGAQFDTRKIQRVDRIGNRLVIQPRCTDLFERFGGAATFREVGAFRKAGNVKDGELRF